MTDLDTIRSRLSDHDAELFDDEDGMRAAVAMILRGKAVAPEVLLIERAERDGDPWSGHMAFPGGRIEADDRDSRAAAERETAEEVGLTLAGAEWLGRLDDLSSLHLRGRPGFVISAHVYHLEQPPPVVANHEVRESLWVPVGDLTDPARHVDYRYSRHGDSYENYPGIQVGQSDRQVVWGLTFRFLEQFFDIIGRKLVP